MRTMTSSTARIGVKLHKNVTLVRTTEPVLAEELLARKTLARWVRGAVVGYGALGPAG